MRRLTDRPFRELLAEFASSAPTPGGGSAAALAASVAFALLTMVARMPRTRTGTDDERATLDRVSDEVQKLGEHAIQLINTPECLISEGSRRRLPVDKGERRRQSDAP